MLEGRGESGKSARIILLVTGRGGGGFKRGRGNTLCVYYAGITRVIKGRIINMLEYERCYGGSALFKHL